MRTFWSLGLCLLAFAAPCPVFADARETADRATQTFRALALNEDQRKELISSFEISCTVTTTVKGALQGEPGAFAENLQDVAARLGGVDALAQRLRKAADFRKYASRSVTAPADLRNGDQILAAISAFAQDAAATVAKIREKGGDETDILQLSRDAAEISDLLLQFMTMR